MRRERRALHVRQHAPDSVGPARLDRFAECPVGADEDTARNQELGDVHVEGGLGGTERRRREVDEHRTFVRVEHVAQVEAAVGDARCVKPGDLPPEILQRLVAHLIGAREFERVDVRLGG